MVLNRKKLAKCRVNFEKWKFKLALITGVLCFAFLLHHHGSESVDGDFLMNVFASNSPKNKQCRVYAVDPGMGLCHYIPGHGNNFGDMIGPDVVKELLTSYFDCPVVDIDVRGVNHKRANGKSCFVSLGSVMHMVKPGDTVWATGVNPNRPARVPRATPIYAVRGPLTKDYLGGKLFLQTSFAYGDPGLLVPYLFPEFEKASLQTPPHQSSPRHCLVPHYHDLPVASEVHNGLNISLTIITPRDDWRVVVNKLATQCDYVASSSLHGLVLADSLGLPVLWWQSDKSIVAKTEGYFKYLDYFGGFVAAERRHVKKPESDWYKIADTAYYLPPIPKADRDAYATALIQTFPFNLFVVN
jgi:pyruvyltransferase